MKVLVSQLCLTLCNLMDCSLQTPLFLEFSKQEYWSMQSFPSPGDLPNSGIELGSPASHADSLPSEPPEKPIEILFCCCSHRFISSDQFSSVAQLCLTLCNPMNRSMPGLPVHHQLPEFTQTHIHQVSDAIQPFHPLSSPSPSAPNPSQHQSLFQ